jgi:ribosomal protein L29
MTRRRNNFLENLKRTREAKEQKPVQKPVSEMTLEELEDEERRVKRELLEQRLEQDLARLNKATADKQRRPSLAPILGRKARRHWK